MKKIIVITGPTGVGKTKLSVELAKKFSGEIINGDAMQVYKGLNIGTAKIKEEEKENIPHHLFDIKEVTEEYTIYHYQKDARKIIDEVIKRNNTPIIVGGTALYIKAALYDYKLNNSTKDKEIYDKLSNEELYNKLIKLDNKAINKIDKNNRRRIINALIHYEENNESITENITEKQLYDTIFIGLTTKRDNLYNRINKRTEKMLEEGLIDEVKYYYDKKILTKPILNGIGYKEVIKYLEKDIDYETTIEKIKQNSRHYAKRQYTFMNNKLNIKWFETNYEDFSKTIEEVTKYIEKEVNK